MVSDMTHPDLIGTAEAAEIIGCDRSAISHWIKQGRIAPAMKVHPGRTGAHLFDRTAVEAFAAEYRQEVTA